MTYEDLKYEGLIGRPFTEIGRDDCFALVREFYRDNFAIEIENFARPNDWNSDDVDLINMLYERAGFDKITQFKVKDIRPGDILAMAVGERNPNHLAIYVGDNKLLHHLYGRMSDTTPMHSFWLNQTCFILRHSEVPDLRPVYPDVHITDLINARNTPTEG